MTTEQIAIASFGLAVIGLLSRGVVLLMGIATRVQAALDEQASLRRHHNNLQQNHNELFLAVKDHEKRITVMETRMGS